jgi:WD40 repeat protein
LVFSPDGKTLGVVADSAIYLLKPALGECYVLEPSVKEFSSWIQGIVFSPDSKALAAWGQGSGPHFPRFVQWASDKFPATARWVYWGGRTPFRQTGDGRMAGAPVFEFASPSNDGAGLQLWDVRTGKRLRTLGDQQDSVETARFSADGTLLATGGIDETIRLWDVTTGKQVHQLHGGLKARVDRDVFVRRVCVLAFSSNLGTAAAYCSEPSNVPRLSVLDLQTGKVLCDLRDGERYYRDAAFTPDGESLVARDPDQGKIVVWSTASGNKRRTLYPLGNLGSAVQITVNGLCVQCELTSRIQISPNGQRVACSTGSPPTIHMWDIGTAREAVPPQGGLDVTRLGFSPDGKSLGINDSDGKLHLWDCITWKERYTVSSGWNFAFCAQGKAVLTEWGATSLLFSDTQSGRRVRTWDVGRRIFDFSLSQDGATISIRCQTEEGTGLPIAVYRVATGRPIAILPWNERARPDGSGLHQTCSTLSPNGRQLAVSLSDETVEVWEVLAQKRLFQLRDPRGGGIKSVVYSPDGNWLVTTAEGRDDTRRFVTSSVRLWEATSGKMCYPLGEYAGQIDRPVFSSDSRLLAGIFPDSLNEEIIVWEASTGKEILRLGEKLNFPRSIDIAPDGNSLASSMGDGTALVWTLAPPGWLANRGEVTPSDLDKWWADLSSDDVRRAYTAVWSLSACPKAAIPFLKERIRPIWRQERGRIELLVAQLNDDHFQVREKSTRALKDLGWEAGPALRKALAGNPNLDMRRRVEVLLETGAGWPASDPGRLRALRAIWVLERIGTREACTFLQELQNGDAEDPRRLEARSAYTRLARKLGLRPE